MFVKNGATLVAALSLLAGVDAKRQQLQERGSRCNGDNLLNRFRNAKYSDAAISFCQTYINSVTYSVVTVSTDEAHISSPVTTYSTAYPTPLLTTSYADSRLSSACSCVSPSAVTAVVTEYVASTTSASSDDPATSTSDDSATITEDPSATATEDPSPTATDSATSTTDAPAGPTSLGCYVEGAGGRALQNLILANDTLTVEMCADACSRYAFYGVEYGRECWCDDRIERTAFVSPDPSVCNFACKGDASETCGGRSTINIYGAAPADTAPPPESPYTLTGCFAEPDGARALPQLYASTKMTIELCHQDCSLAGYTYAGLEYSTECWCGNSIPALDQLSDSECSAACAGNATETCGGNNALQLYTAVAPIEEKVVETK